MHEKKPRKVRVFTDQEIEQDIERYRQKAIEQLGLTDAKMIAADKVYVDPRVRIKCIIPKCPSYNVCAHCPPHSEGYETIKELVSAFKYALLMKLEVPGPGITGPGMMETKGGKLVPSAVLRELLKSYRKVADSVTEIESDAFYDGHYLAVGFAGGACKTTYCNFQDCSILEGEACRFPLIARPSMEGSSIDAFRTAAEAGWEVYPIGADSNPANIPYGTLIGLVMIA